MVSESQVRAEINRLVQKLEEAHKQASVANIKVIKLANMLERKGIIDNSDFTLIKDAIR